MSTTPAEIEAPAHARPVWCLIVANERSGFLGLTHQHQSPNEAAAWQFAAGAEMGWSLASNKFVPLEFDPDTATFGFLAESIADLPDFDEGDRVSIRLGRPTVIGSPYVEPLTYHEVTGTVTDVVITAGDASDRYPITCRITVVDHKAALENITYEAKTADQSWGLWSWGHFSRLLDLALKCRLNIGYPAALSYPHTGPAGPEYVPIAGPVQPGGQTALSLLRSVAASVPAIAWRPGHVAQGVTPTLPDGVAYLAPMILVTTGTLWPSWGSVTPQPADYLTLIANGDTPDWAALLTAYRGVPEADVDGVPARTAVLRWNGANSLTLHATPTRAAYVRNPIVPAHAVTLPTTWKRDRRTYLTDLSIAGTGPESADVTAEIAARPAGVARNAARLAGSSWLPDIPIDHPYPGNTARNLLDAYAPWLTRAGWAIPDIPIAADMLTDAWLDGVAQAFRPWLRPTPGWPAPPGGVDYTMTDNLGVYLPDLTVYGVDEALTPGGHTLGGLLTGCRFRIETDGALTIVARPGGTYSEPNSDRPMLGNVVRPVDLPASITCSSLASSSITCDDVRTARYQP